MLRTALTLRWALLFLLLLVVSVAFIWLGAWQLSVAQDTARTEALRETATAPVVELDELMTPQGRFPDDGSLRPVTTTGSYAVSDEVLIPGRVLDGETGYWVLTRFVVDGTGANLPVVRGFVTDAAAVPPAASGPVELAGALAPPEAPAEGGITADGTLGSVDLGVLVNAWPGRIYHGFVFLTGEDPVATDPAIAHIPPPLEQGTGLDWRNAGYAIQWWVFTAFAWYLAWRMLREEHRAALEERADSRDETPAAPPQEMSRTHG